MCLDNMGQQIDKRMSQGVEQLQYSINRGMREADSGFDSLLEKTMDMQSKAFYEFETGF